MPASATETAVAPRQTAAAAAARPTPSFSQEEVENRLEKLKNKFEASPRESSEKIVSAATRHAPPRRGRRRPIAREHNITFGEFHRKYLATSTPVIVSGSMEHGHVSHAELVELCGERPLRHRCDNESATVRYRHESAAEGWGGMRLLRGLEGSAVFRNLSQLIAAQQDEGWSMRVEADPNDLSSRPVDQLRDTASTGQHTVLGPQLYLHDTRISTLCPALLERVRPPRYFPVDQLRQLAGADFDKDDCRAYEYRLVHPYLHGTRTHPYSRASGRSTPPSSSARRTPPPACTGTRRGPAFGWRCSTGRRASG